MSDLSTKLRSFGDGSVRGNMMYEAADEIEKIEAENATLRELLIDVNNCFGVSMRGSTYNEVQIPHTWYVAVEEALKGGV